MQGEVSWTGNFWFGKKNGEGFAMKKNGVK
jgi:hypothetical protein